MRNFWMLCLLVALMTCFGPFIVTKAAESHGSSRGGNHGVGNESSDCDCASSSSGYKSKAVKLSSPIPANHKMCQNATVSESDIARDIFYKHYSWERPLINARKPIEIEIRLVLSSINDVIEKDKILKLTGYLLFYWWDEYYVWNTTFPHACLATVVMSYKEVWIPEVAMINSEQHYELLLMHNEESVRMYSTGYASYRPGGTFRAYCDFDLTYFPFDEQNCILQMESWRYTVDFQKFHFGDTIQLRYWIENEQWKLKNLTQRIYNVQYVTNNVFCRVEFEMAIKRKVGYYLINVIVPSVIISVAEVATFTLPVDEVMKIHISFTCLLAYGVFQLMIIEDIPRTSDRIPLLCYYIALSMGYICLAMLGEGLVFVCFRKSLDTRHKQYVPEYIYKLALVLSKLLGIKKPKSGNALDSDEQDNEHSSSGFNARYSKMEKTPFVSLMDWAVDKPTELEKKQELQRREMEEKITHHDEELHRQHRWEFVADVFDRFVLVIYLFFIITTPIVMFVIVPNLVTKY